MKLTTKTSRRAIGAAALATILATAASAGAPSWPTPPAPQAESGAPPQVESPAAPEGKPASRLSPARLAQMLAPIALYPDDLLADILLAATYPLDVVEAARWLQDPKNAALKGDPLFAALQEKSWDPSVKALAPFPRILRMLDASIEWTDELGEAYLADPGAVMDAVQRLRRRAQSAGRLVTTAQEIVRAEQAPTRLEELITIEAPGPEVVYVPICDPSFAYGPWPYPDFPPFFPVFAGATIGGCGWIGGPIIAPFFAVLNFRKRHIEIDRKRLALIDRERDRGHALREERRHDPGHSGAVPGRDGALRALLGSRTPAANVNPALRGRWMSPVRAEGPVGAPLPWRRPGMEGGRAPLDRGRPRPEGALQPALEGADPAGMGTRLGPSVRDQPRFGGAKPALQGVDPAGSGTRLGPSARDQPRFGGAEPALQGVDPAGRGTRLGQSARAQPRFGGAEPALQGVDPTENRAPLGQSLTPDAETRMRIERGLSGPVPALAAPVSGRAPPSFSGMRSPRVLGDRRAFRPLVGVGAPPFGARGPQTPLGGAGAGGGRGPQTPSGGLGAGGGRGGG